MPVWSIAKRMERTGRPDAELLSVYRDWGVVRKSDRDDNFNVESDDLSTYKFVQPGDLVLNKMKTWQGSLGVSDYEGIVSPAYFVCQLSPMVHGRYLHYLLRSNLYIAMYAANSKGIRPNQWDMPYEVFRALPVLLPPLEEQRRIAGFLDDQTTRIDRMVDARTAQIGLLIEELITELDATVWSNPDSLPLKFLASDVTSGPRGWGDLVGEDGERLFLRIGNLAQLGIFPVLADVLRVTPPDSAEARRARVATDDVLIGITASIGEVAVIDGSLAGSAFSQHVARIRPLPSVNSRWLAWALHSHRVRAALTTAAYGGTKVALGLTEVLEVQVPACSECDQRDVAARAEATFEAWKGTNSRLEQSIGLLQEFKRSLISAAVSGEFDVSAASGRGVPV